MPKYTIRLTFTPVEFTIDTDDFEDFAKTKEDLVNDLDPNNTDVVSDWAREYWLEYDLCEVSDIDAASADVKLAE